MRKIKDILRLHFAAGLSYRDIAQALDIGYGTVVDYLNSAQKADLGWPLPADLDERDLGRLPFPTQPVTGQRRFTDPDFPLDSEFTPLSVSQYYFQSRVSRVCGGGTSRPRSGSQRGVELSAKRCLSRRRVRVAATRR